ncbi:hypothetical protein H920_08321 [Fukomys damarensis]|uniref:Uncharacterized protein n=1 Tax=Fukomys damarensis TaxID=885580 RepID=A0A091DJ52_FUKDA|nr:hypothetical protein H920_08321 [Fukomys damarensis]
MLPNATTLPGGRLAGALRCVLTAHSLRLPPCNFRVFLKVKTTTKGKRCESVRDIEAAVVRQLKSLRKEDSRAAAASGRHQQIVSLQRHRVLFQTPGPCPKSRQSRPNCTSCLSLSRSLLRSQWAPETTDLTKTILRPESKLRFLTPDRLRVVNAEMVTQQPTLPPGLLTCAALWSLRFCSCLRQLQSSGWFLKPRMRMLGRLALPTAPH